MKTKLYIYTIISVIALVLISGCSKEDIENGENDPLYEETEINEEDKEIEEEIYFDYTFIPKISPNHEYIAGVIYGEIQILTFPEKELVRKFKYEDNQTIERLEWNPNSSSFICIFKKFDYYDIVKFNINGEKKDINTIEKTAIRKEEKTEYNLTIGWLDWFYDGDSFGLYTCGEDATLYHLNNDGEILDTYKVENIDLPVRSTATSKDGNKLALSISDTLYIWHLEEGNIEIIDYAKGYPLKWIDENNILIHLGNISTGGGTLNGLGILDIESNELKIIDGNAESDIESYEIKAEQISPENEYIIVNRIKMTPDDIEHKFYILDLRHMDKKVLSEDKSLNITNTLWKDNEAYILGRYRQEELNTNTIYKFTEELELIELKDLNENLESKLLGITNNTLYYIETNEERDRWEIKNLGIE